MKELTSSNHRRSAQFKGELTVVGQLFAGNGANGLSYRKACPAAITITILLQRNILPCFFLLLIAKTKFLFFGIGELLVNILLNT